MWRYHSQQLLMNFEMTPKPLLLCYWSGSIEIPGCSLMYTSTDTIIILQSCMTPGGPSMWVTPQKFVGTLLHNTFLAGDKPSPKAKLPPAFLDHLTKFPIDSHVREYQNWTTNCEDRTFPDKHFVWLYNEFMPYQTDPGTPYIPPDFTLGLPAVEDCPQWTGDVPWILDPTEHPRPAVPSQHESASPSSGDERWRR